VTSPCRRGRGSRMPVVHVTVPFPSRASSSMYFTSSFPVFSQTFPIPSYLPRSASFMIIMWGKETLPAVSDSVLAFSFVPSFVARFGSFDSSLAEQPGRQSPFSDRRSSS